MDVTPRYILAPYIPTPHDVVRRLLKLAGVTGCDLVYDLGCGDGRVVIDAASIYGARGVGIDIEPYWIEESRRNAEAAGVADLVRFEVGDAMLVDLSAATVITLYLVGWSTRKLVPTILGQVREGTRIVSHGCDAGVREAERIETFTDEGGERRRLYLWIAGRGEAV
jgi:ubiquinone/menaquinone biosynthesis C-methylase UbiE